MDGTTPQGEEVKVRSLEDFSREMVLKVVNDLIEANEKRMIAILVSREIDKTLPLEDPKAIDSFITGLYERKRALEVEAV